MRKNVLRTSVVLLTGALSLNAQQSAKKALAASYDTAATFSFERAQIASTATPSFWLKGGSLSGSATFYKGLGVAANFTLEHKSEIL